MSEMACSFCELVGLACVALLLFSMSHWIQYYVKMVFFIASALIAAVVPIPLMLPRPRDYRNALIPSWCIIKVGQLLGDSFELQGLENINRNTGGVVLINHQSALDLIVLAKLWPVIGKPTQVAKKEIFYLFPFGLASWLWGTLFINRQNKASARNAMNRESKAINERQSKILIFPEGTRNQSETLLPFKKGPFHVAIQAQCPIQPIVVSRYTFLESNRKYFGRGHSIISVMPEVSTKGIGKDEMDGLISNVQSMMQAKFEELNDEIAAASSMKYY